MNIVNVEYVITSALNDKQKLVVAFRKIVTKVQNIFEYLGNFWNAE